MTHPIIDKFIAYLITKKEPDFLIEHVKKWFNKFDFNVKLNVINREIREMNKHIKDMGCFSNLNKTDLRILYKLKYYLIKNQLA